jgi:hypothetical protein
LIHSFVEANLDWRSYERRRNYLIFADSGISLYALITEALRLCLHEGEEEDMEEEDEEV